MALANQVVKGAEEFLLGDGAEFGDEEEVGFAFDKEEASTFAVDARDNGA